MKHFLCVTKADMKRYIQCETTTIFFFEPNSKTGFWLGVCQGWFHLHGLARDSRNTKQARTTQWKAIARSGIRTRYFPLTKRPRYQFRHETRYFLYWIFRKNRQYTNEFICRKKSKYYIPWKMLGDLYRYTSINECMS